jgi:hypothetical protein
MVQVWRERELQGLLLWELQVPVEAYLARSDRFDSWAMAEPMERQVKQQEEPQVERQGFALASGGVPANPEPYQQAQCCLVVKLHSSEQR